MHTNILIYTHISIPRFTITIIQTISIIKCYNYEIKMKFYDFIQAYRSWTEFIRIIEPIFVSTIGSFIKRTELESSCFEWVVSFTSLHVSQECRRREIILLQEASSGSFNERNILNGGGWRPHCGIVAANFIAVAKVNHVIAGALDAGAWWWSYPQAFTGFWPLTQLWVWEEAQEKYWKLEHRETRHGVGEDQGSDEMNGGDYIYGYRWFTSTS